MNKPGLLVVAPITKFYIILIFIALTGCASTGSYTPEGNRITNVEEAFKNGKVRLTCKSFSCVSAYGYNGHKLKELHDNEMWHDLVISVVNIGFNIDLAYYYLGISAEKLGNYDAANIYYTLALAAYISPGRDSSPDRCKLLFIDNCLGFVFPEDAQDGLERIKHIVEENNTTGIQKAQAGVFDDFDSGLRVGRDHYGNPIGFITFRDSASSVINISTTSDHPQLPGEADNNQVLQLDLDTKAWAGVLHRFENAVVDTWTPRDWRGFDGFSFWLYGNNTNKYLFVEILDNRKSRLASHGAELYTYTFTDNFSGWKLITVPFEELVRKEIGNDAPSDGLGLSEVHGWAFGTLNTGGSITYYIDDFEILPVLVSNDSSSVIDGGDTEAPLSLDDQISGTDIMRGSIWHTDFTEVDGKPKQTTSIAYIERKGTPNIGGTGAVPAPNSSWFAAVEVRNKEMALVLKSGDKAVQQKELFKVPKEDRLVAWPAWSPSGDQIAIIHAQLDKQRRRFSYNVTIADINGANISRHMLPEGTLHFPASMAPFNKFSWSPDEKKILISWEKAGVLNVDTGRFTRISDEPIIATWAPNSNSVYYFGMDSDIRKRGLNNFYKRDLDSAKPIKLADKSGYKKNGLRHSWCCAYGNLSFSPSGSKLMFAGGSNNEMEDVIRVYSIERDKPVDIFKPSQKLPIDAMIISTQWAPDEKSIAVLAARIEPSLELTVEILSLETQKRKTVTKIDVPGNVSEIVIMDSIGFSKSLSWTQ